MHCPYHHHHYDENDALPTLAPGQLKAVGNDLYREGKYEEAIKVFTALIVAARASLMMDLDILQNPWRPPTPVAELLSVIYCNRAAA
jgi:hypothetical protein